jgi:diaminohydroxyphosphoribosylaminopyrimidine deaminase/5-amino-6-(5-phosphoribosylamino)uracil reductase
VSGKGIEHLRAKGVQVHVGLCAEAATRLNQVFFHFIRHARPFVTLKLAMTLDGKIATGSGQSKWITGEKARRWVHRLRYDCDAVLVGINTVLQDNPSLDVRWRRHKTIMKVVLDSRLRTSGGARLFASGDPVVIFHADGITPEPGLAGRAKLMAVPGSANELSWSHMLRRLGEMSVTSLLVEGGSQVAASLIRRDFVNKACFVCAPRLLGATGLAAVGDLGVETLDQTPMLRDLRVRRLPPDVLIEGTMGTQEDASQ